ncbi:MAG: bifunctional [glutamine synthetase] adenylyltransferase/[glutamine synthetase]-adenylyl-L-tyrosine phosphorylase, partial [Acidimicrobiia bacterium]|nr:bifunctional [glutamine synthetase] adenylyltransferase/[glutamine synthetase]-adenylyl-L-tyrosine phosphorylase [Acidimicrobiia bacterium]
DLLFVHQPVAGAESESRDSARRLASRLVADLSTPTLDGTSFRVDLGLRPEGAAGPLSRSLDGYAAYYERWAEPWELQALLKARGAAGDRELRGRFEELAASVVWDRGLDADSLRNIRQLKARAEERSAPHDIKRSRGGIRDIEFTVQLLQLVHGRFDPDLRARSTLEVIRALGDHGYVTADEADELAESYKFLRSVEHRIQLWDLEQTHVLPDDEETRARIGRGLGLGPDPVAGLETRLAEIRSRVRNLHERLYFRPILDSLAGLPKARLDRVDASRRLQALGFRDTVAAATAFSEMTSGLSRRSRVMQQVLPLTLDWLSISPDPDLGLAQLRLLLAHSPDHSALVSLLQGNPLAGERLCLLLGTGKLLGELIDRIPEFIPRLASDELIRDVRDVASAKDRLTGLIDSRPGHEAKIGTIRRFVRRRKLRIAARDVLGEAPAEVTLGSLSDSADAAIDAALRIVCEGEPEGIAVIAMGKWGGRELSYGSDLDLMYVRGDSTDSEQAVTWAASMSRVLSEPNKHGEAYQLDADLRPEGRSGALVRSIASYRRYYDEWAEPWELLALVKARPASGDTLVLESYMATLEPHLWGRPLSGDVERHIRSIKARVEAERIPAGEDPDFHLKLGPGGLSDIEFVTQLLQLRHGREMPEIRVTSTLEALRLLRETEILTLDHHTALSDSYLFCTKVRLRLHLQRGRATDSLPTDPGESSRLALSMGFGRTAELREQYRRYTRRARRTFEALFYE